jgi:hypothetical protein
MTMDDLITQLMEQGQGSTAPPPASNDTLESLPRYKADKILADGEKECTVCKDNFTINEDVVRLPCLHVLYDPISLTPAGEDGLFLSSHEDCIMPWLKINGSCPVCRYNLNGESRGNNSESPGGPSNNNNNSNNPNNYHDRSSPSSSRSPQPQQQQQQQQQQQGGGTGVGGFFSGITSLLGNIGTTRLGTSRTTEHSGTTGHSAGESGNYQQQGGRSNSLPPQEDLD